MGSVQLDEAAGRMMMTNLFTLVWLGDWDGYEKMMREIPDSLTREFPFHLYYDRREVDLWYDNHFLIPGDHYISPYLSAYGGTSQQEIEKTKQSLLCLIGLYEKTGFYFPIDQEEFPDHIGSLTAFLTAALSEEVQAIKAGDTDLVKDLQELERETFDRYLEPVLEKLDDVPNERIENPFWKEFLTYFRATIESTVYDRVEKG